MSEPQYKRYKDLPRNTLGIMANQLWEEDPKLLGIHLARYKFVSKMLAGKKDVAEIGCGDGFYSKLVREGVENLDLYDLDDSLGVNISAYDVTGKITSIGQYDAIYSLDCFEHIAPDLMGVALSNIISSLTKNGTFIIGMPSLESQEYASPSSKEGHVNCKTGEDLLAILKEYFHNVFMFSMNDETLHTGFFPMSHYLLGVCCGVR